MSVMPPPLDEVNWSDLITKSGQTAERLTRSRAQSLRIKRRDAEDLVLLTATKAEEEHAVATTTARLFTALLRHSSGLQLLADAVMDIFPWVKFLPPNDASLFAKDLIETLRAVEELDTAAPFLQVITEWRHTAEAHADPELAATLRAGVQDDLGSVERPPAA